MATYTASAGSSESSASTPSSSRWEWRGGFQLTLQHQRGIGGCNAGQETDAGGRGSGGEAAAVCAADRAGGQQRGGVPAGGDQPQDGHSLAVWPASPEFRRGARALSAGADQGSQAA